jgi:hypothetical protein
MDKHSSLLRKVVTYGQKSFVTLAPEIVVKQSFAPFTFYQHLCTLRKSVGEIDCLILITF